MKPPGILYETPKKSPSKLRPRGPKTQLRSRRERCQAKPAQGLIKKDLYTYTYTCISISLYLYISISIYLYIYISTYLYIYIPIYLYLYLYIYRPKYPNTYIHIYIYLCILLQYHYCKELWGIKLQCGQNHGLGTIWGAGFLRRRVSLELSCLRLAMP